MQLNKIEMPQDEAKEKWREQCRIIRENGSVKEYDTTLKRVYHALSQGHDVLDIVDVMKHCPFNKMSQPRLAIARTDAKNCYFHRRSYGGGWFSDDGSTWGGPKKHHVTLPANTFKDSPWASQEVKPFGSKRVVLKTAVPEIPAQIMQDRNPKRYYVLWEVDHWSKLPPSDPLLLRTLGTTIFEIIDEWELTDLEYAVMLSASLG